VKAVYRRRGWYASVEQEGEVSKGDAIEELSGSLATITKMVRATTAHSGYLSISVTAEGSKR